MEKERAIKQKVTFDAAPAEIYDMLMDSKKHAEFTGAGAKIENKVGGKFSVWDGWAFGKTVELAPGKRIVQEWGCEEDGWPEGHMSRVTFALKPKAGGKTELSFAQTGVPAGNYASLSGGWKDNYWELMKASLARKKGA